MVSQANSIADNASELSAQIKMIDKLEQDIRAAWKGQAADAFFSRLSMLKGNMCKTRQQMVTLASTIKYCAERIHREDEEANRRAKALKSFR